VFSAIIGTLNLIDCVPLERERVLANRDVSFALQPQHQVPRLLLTDVGGNARKSCLWHKE
jgi:hypothetical protein